MCRFCRYDACCVQGGQSMLLVSHDAVPPLLQLQRHRLASVVEGARHGTKEDDASHLLPRRHPICSFNLLLSFSLFSRATSPPGVVRCKVPWQLGGQDAKRALEASLSLAARRIQHPANHLCRQPLGSFYFRHAAAAAFIPRRSRQPSSKAG